MATDTAATIRDSDNNRRFGSSSTRPSGPLSPSPPLDPFRRHGFPDAPCTPAESTTIALTTTTTTTAQHLLPSSAVSSRPPRVATTAESSTTAADDTPRSVRFSPRNSTCDTISRYDMSPSEHRNYWLQGDELRTMRRRNRGRKSSDDRDGENDVDGSDRRRRAGRPRGDIGFRDDVDDVDDDDLRLPGLESSSPRNTTVPHPNPPDDGLHSSIYDFDGFDDPFAEVCFEAVGVC